MRHDNIIKLQLESDTDVPVIITINEQPERIVISGKTFYEVLIKSKIDYVITIEQENNELDTTISFKKLLLGKFDITGILRHGNFDNTSNCNTISKSTGKSIGRYIETLSKDEKVILNVPNAFTKYVIDKIHLIKVFEE
jgi:hypothetical protein